MEVKVFCVCGSKYKFDVEPVNERMPWPVNCPACGADGTAQANEIIAQTLAANPAAAALAPVPMPAPAPVPVFAAAAAPPPPPAPTAGGLRINRPEAHAPAAPPPIGGAPPPIGAAPARFTPASTRPLTAARPPAGEPMWKKIAGGAFGFLVVALFVARWVYRIARISHAISTPGDLPNKEQLTATLTEMKEYNLLADNSVVLYVKHDDHREVAKDCLEFWKEKDHQNFVITTPDHAKDGGKEYTVYPAHNGYVRVMSALNWKEAGFESTAQHLSEKYHTVVFDEKDVDFSGAFTFGVYDQGSNVFHARMTVSKNGDEKVKVEHTDWAEAHGYKPNAHGNKDFDIIDANKLTKTFGMKFWDEQGESPTNFLLLTAAKK